MIAPEFISEELNLIDKLERTSTGNYYMKVKNFVMNYVDGFSKWDTMSDKQKKWLLAIKKELSDLVKEDY